MKQFWIRTYMYIIKAVFDQSYPLNINTDNLSRVCIYKGIQHALYYYNCFNQK